MPCRSVLRPALRLLLQSVLRLRAEAPRAHETPANKPDWRLEDHPDADGYGVLNLPGRAPMCFLVELDRGTEPTKQLYKKAQDYEQHLYRSALRRRNPFVLVLVPSATRARTVSAAVADSTAPIAVAVWSNDSTGSTLAVVIDAKNGLQQARPAPAGEGLRSAAGSALLDHPRDPDRELELTP